ncbi:MAG TPA: methyltransferase domain-containing protein [Thermomicrobiales bacterium]|nr:methyltransferase domain-containing protein [Thermomicrobiales bacterium]
MARFDYAKLYDETYFARYNVRTPEWLDLWARHADRIVRGIGPRSVLDAGCARGLLVEALRERDVDAFGVDVSAHAIGEVRDDIKPYCRVASIAEPLPRRYDLIVCHEVLEHLPREEGARAIENLCRAADDLLIGTTPGHYDDPTHVNVQPPEYWATLLAEWGFYHDLDYDASFLSPWAKRFRKVSDPLPRVIGAYERRLWRLTQEVDALRARAVETNGQLGDYRRAAERERALEQEVARVAGECEHLRFRLASIEGRLGWRVLAGFWRAQSRLMPPTTLRGRLWLALARRIQRRLR